MSRPAPRRPSVALATALVAALAAASAGCGDSPTEGVLDSGLRQNVQGGQAPNADGQTPAFEGQTRAPQPAERSALTIDRIADGLEIPWGIAPLPDGHLLVTERAGRLRVVAPDGTLSDPVSGVPEVVAEGQGGLLDVVIGPEFDTDRTVFLTFVEQRDPGFTSTAVARGTLSDDRRRLDDLAVIYQMEPPVPTDRHFGSRLAVDATGALFVTFGDRGIGPVADNPSQSPFDDIGAVVRILPDGSIPADNPFVDGQDGHPAVWSWGHRNIQSATIGADGALWTVEHGPQGGDELNRPEAGVNHGWPVVTYGEQYGGGAVLDGETAADGVAQPVYYWDPVIAPSDMVSYDGDLFADWNGDLLVGGLKAESVVRLSLRDGRVYTEEWISMGTRVRSLALAADGAVLVGTDDGEILALRPE